MAEREQRGRASGLLGWAWGLVGGAACWSVAGLEPNLVEEGMVLHVAERLAGGEALYRDVVFFSGPLPFELLGGLFRIFGAEIAVGRAAQAVLHGLATAALFSLARRGGAGALAHAAAACLAATPLLLFPLFSMYYYTPLAFVLGVLAADAGERGLRHVGWAVVAGVLVAGVALCKQTLGLALVGAMLPALLWGAAPERRLPTLRGWILGGAATAAVTLALYAARGDLGPLWRCLVDVPLGLSEQFRAPFINLWPPGELTPEVLANKAVYFSNLYFLAHGLWSVLGPGIVLATQLLYVLPFLALAASAAVALRWGLPPAVAIHGALLVAMTTNVYPRADWGHLVFALPGACVQILLLVAVAVGRTPRAREALVAVTFASVAGLAWAAGSIGVWVHGESARSTWGPRVPLRPVSAVYRIPSVPRVISFLRARIEPGDPIFVARAEPLLYFATGASNPTPFTGVLTVLHEEQQEAILAALPQTKYVVMSDVDQPLWTYYSAELPEVQKHLERHYRIPPVFPLDDASWIIVLERSADRGPTLVDLIDARAEGRPWVRDAPGETRPVEAGTPRLAARHNRRPLPIRLGAWGGGIDYDVGIPERARFDAGIGYRGMVSLDDLHEHPRRSRMVLSIRRAGSEDFEVVHEQRVSDGRKAGRGWSEFAADLSPWAGERVTLRLECVPDAPVGTRDLAWWGSPRIAGPAGS